MDIAAGGTVLATRWDVAHEGADTSMGAREGTVTGAGESAGAAARESTTGQLGIAVDVGTTTVVARLYDLTTGACLAAASRPNPQARFGADVISRIAAVRAGHLGELTALIRNTVSGMTADLLAAAGCTPSAGAGAVAFTCLCGNTVMEHLFAGVDPTPIGLAPFTPPYTRDFPCETAALTLAPCVAGYVGGDVVADLLALDMPYTPAAEGPVLLLDLGTNGEIALGDERGVFACATAAGPVFEGAQIECGMPAYEGAICGVSRDATGNLVIETVGDVPAGKAAGICGSGLVDALALMLDEGVIDERGRWADRTLPANERRFALTPRVYVSQKDVRAFQLAKAAIAAGTQVLLNTAGIAPAQVARVFIAGGLGSHLNLISAALTGLIPPGLLACTEAVGNTAIEGAALALVNPDARKALDAISAGCTYIELSGNRDFDARYVQAMNF